MSSTLELAVPPVPASPHALLAPSNVTLCRFNQRFFGRKDLLEGAGLRMKDFSFAVSYPVSPEKPATVVESLFTSVMARLQTASIPDVESCIMDFDDVGTGKREAPRRYLVVRTDTVRSTHMELFATFRSFGDYLYVSVGAYFLPPLSLLRLFVWNLPVLPLLPYSWLFGATLRFVFLTFFVLPLLLWHNRSVVASLVQGDSLGVALRRHFHKVSADGTFDRDDVLAHFKSTVSLVTEEIATVFEKYGIPVDVLNQVRQTINLSTTITNSGVMNVLGSVFMGMGNKMEGSGRSAGG